MNIVTGQNSAANDAALRTLRVAFPHFRRFKMVSSNAKNIASLKRVFALSLILYSSLACTGGSRTQIHQTSDSAVKVLKQTVPKISPKVEISFAFNRQHGMASNQFAIWIEKIKGSYIQTLYTTRWAAEGDWKIWDASLTEWKNAVQP